MEKVYLMQIAGILLFTKALGMITRKVHMPQVVGALTAGVILGPVCLNLVDATETLNVLAEFGVILLMFSAGMETDMRELKKTLGASFVIAMLGVLIPIVSGFLLAYFVFQEKTVQSIFLGIILAATSVSITVETLNELGKLKSPAGTAILGAAIIDDILGILILSIIISVDQSTGSVASTILWSLAKIGVFILIALILGFMVSRLFTWMYRKYQRTRRLPIFSLAFCLALAWLAENLGIADITGAYIAGLVFCSLSVSEYIEQKTEVLSYMFFSPIFFASIGLKTTLADLSSTLLLFTLLYFLIAVFSKIIGCGLGGLLCRYTGRESLQIAFGMVSRGEVLLIMANVGITSGILETKYFSPIVIVVILTSLLTPLLLKRAYHDTRPSGNMA